MIHCLYGYTTRHRKLICIYGQNCVVFLFIYKSSRRLFMTSRSVSFMQMIHILTNWGERFVQMKCNWECFERSVCKAIKIIIPYDWFVCIKQYLHLYITFHTYMWVKVIPTVQQFSILDSAQNNLIGCSGHMTKPIHHELTETAFSKNKNKNKLGKKCPCKNL